VAAGVVGIFIFLVFSFCSSKLQITQARTAAVAFFSFFLSSFIFSSF
jgi:hypothetical protein